MDKESFLSGGGRSPGSKSFPVWFLLTDRVSQAGLQQPHSSRDKTGQLVLGGEGVRRDGLRKMGEEGLAPGPQVPAPGVLSPASCSPRDPEP